MTPRTRRVGEVLIVVVALLFTGRWTAAFLTERWWAATVAPGASGFYTSWTLLGVALDAGAIVAASLWFALHALIVARAIASVQIAHRIGDLQLREAVPVRVLMIAAIASGILLGLIAGSGAHAWREPIALAWQGVSYGVTDPLLHIDVGILVAQLPAWDLLQNYLLLLTLLGLAFCITLYGAIGAMRFAARTMYLHADARRHLGVLLACVALVLAFGYVLAPYHLALATLTDVSIAGLALQVRAADVVAGIAAATAVLSAIWAVRGRNALIVAAWTLLAASAFAAHFLVPGWTRSTPVPSSRLAVARQFNELAWGITPAINAAPIDSIPKVTSLWDGPLLGMLVERSGGPMLAASRSMLTVNGAAAPVWLVATPAITDSNRLELLAISDSGIGPTGSALLLRPDADLPTPRPAWTSLLAPRAVPDGPPWRATASGVDARGVVRRLMLAWARQAPGIMADRVTPAVDWHVDPVERAAAVLPMLSWTAPSVALVGGRMTWVVSGFVVVGDFPVAAHAQWADDDAGGVVPAVVASIDAEDGKAQFYLDPSAGPLALAWARIIGPLVEPAASMPPAVRSALSYPGAWLAAQATVLAAAPSGGRVTLSPPAPVWVDGLVPAVQLVSVQPSDTSSVSILTGFRADGRPQLKIERQVIELNARGPWAGRMTERHLRDSVLATGDSVAIEPTRWYAGSGVVAGWQPLFAIPRHGAPTLLRVQTIVGESIGGGSSARVAWQAAMAPDENIGAAGGPDDGTLLNEAREWVGRADSALRRGDMTAFGRAFEALRSTLQRPSH